MYTENRQGTNKAFKDNNFKNISPERQREIARQGGIRSGEVRRAKKKKADDLNNYCQALLNVGFKSEFTTPEELRQFRKWKKAKAAARKAKRDRLRKAKQRKGGIEYVKK